MYDFVINMNKSCAIKKNTTNKNMDKKIKIASWLLISVGILIVGLFLLITFFDGYTIFTTNAVEYDKTGQIGDFIGGVVGTIFTLLGTVLIYLTFRGQIIQNKKDGFETIFLQLLSIQRDNVNQLNYTTSNSKTSSTAKDRKVFKVIFTEFLECYREVKKFSNSTNSDEYIIKKHKKFLEGIISDNLLEVDIIEMAIIDIAYNIVYFGLSEDGQIILRHKFQKRYSDLFFYPLLNYIKLKPKKENIDRWKKWELLMSYDYKRFQKATKDLYDYNRKIPNIDLTVDLKNLIHDEQFDQYYNGHQHRLGHYFRHLFQSVKFINYNDDIEEKDKYFYAKTLRAQLSTYEQALLFINSISSLGYKWELLPETKLLKKGDPISKCKLITNNHLIKNLPGHHLSGIRYKSFYPEISYEFDD